MARKTITALAVLATAAVGAGLGFAPAADANTINVTIAGTTFLPPAIPLSPGGTLTATNLDPTSHTMTADAVDGAGLPLFDTPLIGPNQTASVSGVSALAPGDYTYHCQLHAWMHGVLAVQALPAS